jgi:hypothetical protein
VVCCCNSQQTATSVVFTVVMCTCVFTMSSGLCYLSMTYMRTMDFIFIAVGKACESCLNETVFVASKSYQFCGSLGAKNG